MERYIPNVVPRWANPDTVYVDYYCLVASETIKYNTTVATVLLLTTFLDFEPMRDRLTEPEVEKTTEAERDSESEGEGESASESHSESDSSSGIYRQDFLSSSDLSLLESSLVQNIMAEF